MTNDDPNVAAPLSSSDVADEESSFFDQEVREMGDLIDEFEKIKEMSYEPEEFRVVPNRAAKRAQAKRNRALIKRKPNG